MLEKFSKRKLDFRKFFKDSKFEQKFKLNSGDIERKSEIIKKLKKEFSN
jgi:uncharacterized membrane protein